MVRYAAYGWRSVPSGSYSYVFESDDACIPVHPVGNLLIGKEKTKSMLCRQMPHTCPFVIFGSVFMRSKWLWSSSFFDRG